VTLPNPTDAEHRGPTFWIALVIGVGVMTYGVWGVFANSRATDPAALARWVIGADLVHDFVLAPIAIGIGWLAGRVAPRAWRGPLQTGLFATGVVLIVGWAPWRGYGRSIVPDNPSVQPLDYSTAIATVLAVIWVGVALAIVVGHRAARARS